MNKYEPPTKTQLQGKHIDFRQSVGLGFYFESKYMYGLPQRADQFLLKTTEKTDPYSLLNKDKFPHSTFEDVIGLYGSVPYVTSHSVGLDSSLLWVNSAETWVDIWEHDFEDK